MLLTHKPRTFTNKTPCLVTTNPFTVRRIQIVGDVADRISVSVFTLRMILRIFSFDSLPIACAKSVIFAIGSK